MNPMIIRMIKSMVNMKALRMMSSKFFNVKLTINLTKTKLRSAKELPFMVKLSNQSVPASNLS